MTDTIKIDTVFKALTDHHLHQDRIIWAQTRTILALQGATLAAGYVARGTLLVLLASAVGVVFTSIVYMFMLKARYDRDLNMGAIQALLRDNSTDEIRLHLPPDQKGRIFRTGSDLNNSIVQWTGLGFPLVRGHILVRVAVFLALTMDLLSIPLFLQMNAK